MSGLSVPSVRLVKAMMAGLPVAPDMMPAAMSKGSLNTYRQISSTVRLSTVTNTMPSSRYSPLWLTVSTKVLPDDMPTCARKSERPKLRSARLAGTGIVQVSRPVLRILPR